MAINYSNSSLVDYTKISPNKNTSRIHGTFNPTGKITKITIHHMAGNFSVEACGNGFASPTRQASSNYAIGTDGRVGLYVDEKHRAWTSSSADNDYKAVTIEVANDGDASTNWHVSDKAYAKLIDLCVDICKRNGISKLNYTGDVNGNLTRHNMFVATSCPGPYLQSKFNDIANKVNKRLSPSSDASNINGNTSNKVVYRVQVGAYSIKANAEKELIKIKNAGFDAFIVQLNGVYKIQVGAYSVKANADTMLRKIKKDGFEAFITTVSPSNEVATFKIGDKVKIKSDAYIYGTKTKFLPFVYNSTLYIRKIDGSKVTISTQKTGDITGIVSKTDLIKI